MATITSFTAELPEALSYALSDTPHQMYLYLEYASTGNVPTITAANQLTNFDTPKSYYSGLTGEKNYIRVKAFRHPDPDKSVAGTSYTASTSFFGQSSPSAAGVNSTGLAFGTGVLNYGAALVLARDPNDKSRDLVLARAYFTDATLTKSASSEIFVTFPFSSTVTTPA